MQYHVTAVDTAGKKYNSFTNLKWFHRFMRTRWQLRVLLCEYMNLLALRTENYFFNAKSLNLTASKNIKNIVKSTEYTHFGYCLIFF